MRVEVISTSTGPIEDGRSKRKDDFVDQWGNERGEWNKFPMPRRFEVEIRATVWLDPNDPIPTQEDILGGLRGEEHKRSKGKRKGVK